MNAQEEGNPQLVGVKQGHFVSPSLNDADRVIATNGKSHLVFYSPVHVVWVHNLPQMVVLPDLEA
jgi:hypothetical protein